MNNGDRKGLNWGAGGGWNDGTPNAWPDWLQITFAGMQSIGEIDVFTLQDNLQSPVEPTETMIFTLRGITAFQVQYWAGSAWVDVPGGSVTGNDWVWRKFTFSPISTDRIRVLVNQGLDRYSRIVEVEAWTATTAPTTTTVVSSLNPATVGASVTFTATVTGSTPTGSVNFTDGAKAAFLGRDPPARAGSKLRSTRHGRGLRKNRP